MPYLYSSWLRKSTIWANCEGFLLVVLLNPHHTHWRQTLHCISTVGADTADAIDALARVKLALPTLFTWDAMSQTTTLLVTCQTTHVGKDCKSCSHPVCSEVQGSACYHCYMYPGLLCYSLTTLCVTVCLKCFCCMLQLAGQNLSDRLIAVCQLKHMAR